MRIRLFAVLSGAVLALSALPLSAASFGHVSAVRPVVLTIGHRGAPAHAPENTLASIDAARRLGVTWVENDVQRTKDGRLIVMHDATLVRTTDARRRYPGRSPWRIADFTLADIERLDAGSWYGKRFAGERVPTLDAYLRRVDHNRQDLLLEIKDPRRYPGMVEQLAARLRADGWLDRAHQHGRLMVQSFDAGAVKRFHRLSPATVTGLLGNPPRRDLAADAGWLDSVNADAAHLTRSYADAVHAVRGDHGVPLRLYAWTVDDPDRAVALAGLGADGVITD
ncbi:glycerophosphodiester phosphodiesterase, partial [Streptantibioticus silvisoli]